MRISDWSSDVCSSDLQWLDELGENILGFLAEYTNAQAGALFIKNGDAFIRRATYGTPAESNIPTRVRPADGLLGQAIKDKRSFLLDALPDHYPYFGSSLGTAKPRQLLIAPAMADGETASAACREGWCQTVEI